MDFMRLLQSVEELLYELVTVFYPITMWRTLRHPEAMMRYADVELTDKATEQYADTLSPPLFLLITLLLAHLLELRLPVQKGLPALPSLLASDSNLLLFRAVVFSIFPLLMAMKLLRYKGTRPDRNTLKPPFYSQCYVAAPFALVLSLAGQVQRFEHALAIAAGLALLAVAVAWYVTIEARWFRKHLNISIWRATASVIATIFEGTLAIFLAGAIIVYGIGPGPK